MFKAPDSGETRLGIGPRPRNPSRRRRRGARRSWAACDELVPHLGLCPTCELLADSTAIERRYPTDNVRAVVTEIQRVNAIAECASDLVRALESARLTTTPKLLLVALVERLETPATGRKRT